MAEGFKETLLTKLLDSVPVLLILLGVGVVLIGLAGGVTYHSWFVMGEPVARTAACILGVALIALGIVFSRSVKHAPLRAADYGIKIQHPVAGDRVESVDVRGTIERLLPDGYSLRIFRIYPGSDNFVPLGKARIDILKKTWVAERCQIGGKTGDQRALAAYIVGASGEVLIDFHNNAVSVHRKTMDAFRKATGTDTDFLPTIAGRTQDCLNVTGSPSYIHNTASTYPVSSAGTTSCGEPPSPEGQHLRGSSSSPTLRPNADAVRSVTRSTTIRCGLWTQAESTR